MTGIPALMRGNDMKFSLGELRMMMMGDHNDSSHPFISYAQLTRLEMRPMPDEDNWAFKKARDVDMKAPAYKRKRQDEMSYHEDGEDDKITREQYVKIPRVTIASTTTTLDEIMTNFEQVLDRVNRMVLETKLAAKIRHYIKVRDKRRPATILQDIKKSRTMTKQD